jgi:hypothetical protein
MLKLQKAQVFSLSLSPIYPNINYSIIWHFSLLFIFSTVDSDKTFGQLKLASFCAADVGPQHLITPIVHNAAASKPAWQPKHHN